MMDESMLLPPIAAEKVVFEPVSDDLHVPRWVLA